MACTCQQCYNPCGSCTCNQYVYTGCPIQLDFSCVIYHKANNEVTELDGLGLPNGSTLELVIETIDEKIKQLGILNFTLPCLRARYVINTMQQFAQAVDTDLCIYEAKTQVLEQNAEIIEYAGSDPVSPDNGVIWYRSDTQELKFMTSLGNVFKITGVLPG